MRAGHATVEDVVRLQAAGLSGHLAMFWPDVQRSMWLNGADVHGDLSGNHSEAGHYTDDGGLHERAVDPAAVRGRSGARGRGRRCEKNVLGAKGPRPLFGADPLRKGAP